jgi:hypothetical protein
VTGLSESSKGDLRALSEELLTDSFPEKSPAWIRAYTDTAMRDIDRVFDDRALVGPARASTIRPLLVALAVFVILAAAAVLLPSVTGLKVKPAASTAGHATITSPRTAQKIELTTREQEGVTDGFTATGTCSVPLGYRALIISVANDNSGYWLLSDGVLSDCDDDGADHRWTAKRVDPTWAGMPPDHPVTIGVAIVKKDVAEQARVQSRNGDPAKLPRPAATTLIQVSRTAPRTSTIEVLFPREGDSLSGNQHVSGTGSDIGNNEVWAVERSGSGGPYYPHGPCAVGSNGAWSCPAFSLRTREGQRFELRAVIVDEAIARFLRNGQGSGLAALPPVIASTVVKNLNSNG